MKTATRSGDTKSQEPNRPTRRPGAPDLLAVVIEAREVLAALEEVQNETAMALRLAEGDCGRRALDDGDGGMAVTGEISDLRVRRQITESAIDEQRKRIQGAERTYLAEQAELMVDEVESAETALAEHTRTLAALLKAVEDHEGALQPRWELDSQRRSLILGRTLGIARARHRILDDLAEGQDPHVWLTAEASMTDGNISGIPVDDLYPACVSGPNAVVAAPRFRSRIQSAHNRVVDLEQGLVSVQAEIDEINDLMAPYQRPDSYPASLTHRLARREHVLGELRLQLAEARRDLLTLTDNHVPNEQEATQ